MRNFAVVVLFLGTFAAGLGIVIGGQFGTVIALVATISSLGLAGELWYVSRRIERQTGRSL